MERVQKACGTLETLGWRIARIQLPRFASWHVAEQTRLIAHLKHFWGGYAAVPRTMVDLGCHAGHGRHKNISDALLWLEEFPGPGLVVGVDAFEDFAFDLQYRFDKVEPYASSPATKRTFALGIGPADNTVRDMTGLARQHIMCCSNTGWCQDMHTQLEARGSDHMCKLVRMRLGILLPDGRLTHRPSRYTSNLTLTLWKNLGQWKKSDPRTKNLYMVPIMRVDTFWSVHLQERHIDFLKIDMDMSWRRMGLEKLFEAQGFTVMVIEVDVSWVPPWGAKRGGVDLIWNLTEADLFAFYASSRGYDVFFQGAVYDAQSLRQICGSLGLVLSRRLRLVVRGDGLLGQEATCGSKSRWHGRSGSAARAAQRARTRCEPHGARHGGLPAGFA